ncbi:hypothetical protein DRQ18_08120 [bacterium]|nr:MAG: hypothetical protein DRQ18_08120 [bacterium]
MGKRVWIILLLALAGCKRDFKETKVLVSITPLHSLVKEIGGEKIEVVSLLTGLENPHTYSPTPSRMREAAGGKVLFLIGGLDEWAIKMASDVPYVRLREGYPPGEENPHIWLDPDGISWMVDKICEKLCELVPEDSAGIKKRAEQVKKRVREIFGKYRIKKKKVVVMFPAFHHFLRHLGVEEAACVFPSPGSSISAKRLASILELIRKEKINVLVTAPFPDEGMADLIARETGVKVVTLTPLPGLLPNTDDLFSMLDENLRRLEDGLGD